MPLTRHERAVKAANASWTPEARVERAVKSIVDNWPDLTEAQQELIRNRVVPVIEGR